MRGKIQGGGVPGPAVFRAAAALLSLSALSAPAFTVPELPPSAFADTEVSTNVAFVAMGPGDRLFSLSLVLDAAASNAVEVRTTSVGLDVRGLPDSASGLVDKRDVLVGSGYLRRNMQ